LAMIVAGELQKEKDNLLAGRKKPPSILPIAQGKKRTEHPGHEDSRRWGRAEDTK